MTVATVASNTSTISLHRTPRPTQLFQLPSGLSPGLEGHFQLMATPLSRHTQHVYIQTRLTTIVRQNGDQKDPVVVEHHTQLPAVRSDIDIADRSVPQLIYSFGYSSEILD